MRGVFRRAVVGLISGERTPVSGRGSSCSPWPFFAYDEGDMTTRVKFPHGDFWLTFSPALDEMPINLVVPRQTLE